jgi:hypothetical protein
VETKEELLREYAKWTVEYVKAKENLDNLLPPVANLSKREQLKPFVITQQSLIEFSQAEKRLNNALRKRREILKKLSAQ